MSHQTLKHVKQNFKTSTFRCYTSCFLTLVVKTCHLDIILIHYLRPFDVIPFIIHWYDWFSTETHVKLGGAWRSKASLGMPGVTSAELKLIGNERVNADLEAELPLFYRRPWPGPSCPAFMREAFVQAKYIQRAFCRGASSAGLQVRLRLLFASA